MKFPRFRATENSTAILARDGRDGAHFNLNTSALLSRRPSLTAHPIPERPRLSIVILGVSIMCSETNGHCLGLVRELCARGHEVLLLERVSEKHAAGRALSEMAHGRTENYSGLKELKDKFAAEVRAADFVMLCSGLPDGLAIGEWVTHIAQGATAFYDLDTSSTMAELVKGEGDYISAALIPRFQIYLSVTGGSLLEYIEEKFESSRARTLYCSVDAKACFPEHSETKCDLGYMGDYSNDRQPTLERLLIEAARRWKDGRFMVVGGGYTCSVRWPRNIKRLSHVPAGKLRAFYNSQRFALNITRAGMAASGFCPGVRLFEAAACGIPIISDSWPGIETFFKPDEEILISHSADETLVYLEEISELDRRRLGYRARERVLASHTARHRAAELESYILELVNPVFAA